MSLSSDKLKNILIDKLYNYDLKLYKETSSSFKIRYNSKKYHIGKPILLTNPKYNKNILLIHGLLAAPAEVNDLSSLLYKEGYNVYAPRLSGHGTSYHDLSSMSWHEWYISILRAKFLLGNVSNNTIIIGFSTGAGLALLECILSHNDYNAVISINTPLKLNKISTILVKPLILWNKLLSRLNFYHFKINYISHNPENPQINYLKYPVYGLYQLLKLMKFIKKRLTEIQIPALIIHGKNDPIIKKSCAKLIYYKLKSSYKSLKIINTKRHGIINGKELKIIFPMIISFLKSLRSFKSS